MREGGREFKCLAILALFVPLLITNGLHDAFRLTYFVSKDTIRLLIIRPYFAGSEDRVSTNVYHGGLVKTKTGKFQVIFNIRFSPLHVMSMVSSFFVSQNRIVCLPVIYQFFF